MPPHTLESLRICPGVLRIRRSTPQLMGLIANSRLSTLTDITRVGLRAVIMVG